jgi:hypothetical protein
LIRTRRGDVLTIPDGFHRGEGHFGHAPCFLPPNASQNVFQINIEEFNGTDSKEQWLKHFADGLVSMHSCGRITYSDVFGLEATVPHETKWFYWHLPFGNALPIPDPSRPDCNTYT